MSSKEKNLMGKGRPKENPYATFKGFGPFGDTTVHLLKSYQMPSKELKNPFAKWFVAIKTDEAYGEWDEGDSYLNEATDMLTLSFASDEFKEQYSDYMDVLMDKGGFVEGEQTSI
jgi:hypothetical protein